MSADAAALQQLRGLIAALGARELSALSEATVTSLWVAAKSVERLACAGASEHARGCWEAALELWNVVVALSSVSAASESQALRLAQLRQVSSGIVHANPTLATGGDAMHTLAYFAFKTGEALYKTGQLEQASAAFAQATSDCDALAESANPRDKELLLQLFCASTRCAWSLKQPEQARALLERAADAAMRLCAGAPAAVVAAASERLASVHFDLARACLAEGNNASAVQFLQSAATHAATARATGVPSAARLHLKTLQCLAVAHLKTGSHASALNCARVLTEQAATSPEGAAASRAARFLCINALCGLCRVDEAAEMLAAATADAVDATDLFAESAITVMRAGRADAAAAAVSALLASGSSHAQGSMRFFEAALADEHGRSPALALLATPSVAGVIKGGPDGDKRTLHLQALLWNAATQQFDSKNYACARELFSAASSYAHVGDPNCARAARAACVCLLAVRQPAEALDYILLAEQLESSGDAPQLSVQTKFLKLKIQLEQGTDDEGALAALQALTQCVDFDIDFLYLAALESQSKNALRCAQEAYTLLYREVTTSGSVGAAKAAACPGYFAQLLRHLIKVTSAKWDAADAVAGHADPARSAELASQMGVACQQLKALGVPAFAGNDHATAARELLWFATNAWNAGLAASVELAHDWASAARLFAAAGTFLDAADLPPYTSSGATGVAHEAAAPSRRLAWLLAAGAALELHSAMLDGDGAFILGEAQHALARCAAAADAAASTQTHVLFLLLCFTASTRAGDKAGSLAILRKAESMPAFTADTALKLARLASMAAAASDGWAVAFRAYELCLRVMQRAPGSSLKDMSYVLRKLVTLSEQCASDGGLGGDNRDVRVLRAFRDASAILAAAPAGAYPSEEAVWLVTTAWNRGALLAKLGRPESAEPLLKCSLELLKHGAKHAPALEAHKSSMTETMAAFALKKRGGRSSAVTREGGDNPIVVD